jgi:hypothetical protein
MCHSGVSCRWLQQSLMCSAVSPNPYMAAQEIKLELFPSCEVTVILSVEQCVAHLPPELLSLIQGSICYRSDWPHCNTVLEISACVF